MMLLDACAHYPALVCRSAGDRVVVEVQCKDNDQIVRLMRWHRRSVRQACIGTDKSRIPIDVSIGKVESSFIARYEPTPVVRLIFYLSRVFISSASEHLRLGQSRSSNFRRY